MKHSPAPSAALDRLRAFCLALPCTAEKASWGHPNFTVAGKIFAAYGEYRGEATIGFKTSLERQADLCREERFYIARYVGKHGWVCLRVANGFGWDELEPLLFDSYRRIAPKRLLADIEHAQSAPVPKRAAKPAARPASARAAKPAARPRPARAARRPKA